MSGRHGKKKMEDEESDGSTEEEEDDSEMEDDEKEIAEEKAYRYYSPLVKSAVGNVAPNLVTDRTIRICEACPTRPRFPGWKALFAHAGTFKKKKRIQHRGLYRALEEALVSEAGKEVGLETRAAQMSILILINFIDRAKELLDKEEEAKFNEQAREREKALMQEQEKEMMRLLDEIENQKQALLEEWLGKQEKLKKDAESKKVAEAANNEECAVCVFNFQEAAAGGRASLQEECAVCVFNFQEAAAGGRALYACGHVGVCMTCAIDIWERQKKKECPLCRAQIKCRPTKLPEVIYSLQ